MKLPGLKDDFMLLTERSGGFRIYLGKRQSNILIFRPIEEPRKAIDILSCICEEEKGYLFDKLNHQKQLVVYIRKLPLMKSSYTLFYQSFDDVLRFIFHSAYFELLEFLKEKTSSTQTFNYMVVKDGMVREVPYF
ncbi:hypothetical protein [Oceanobacillus senegalensis]|uniref:hypothetical protein n=1 Tax=Oceanobacillus senegalensis TaxID=1936063 RepID=UPI000A30A8FA|nr:hypothetical protein [Oceanobacillus senegalensis]